MHLELSQGVTTVTVQLFCSWGRGLVIHFGKDFFSEPMGGLFFWGGGVVVQCFLRPEILRVHSSDLNMSQMSTKVKANQCIYATFAHKF